MAKKSGKKKISFQELTDSELDKMHGELAKEKQEIRFKLVTSSVPNVRRVRQIKKDIARILTVKTSRKKQVKQA